MEILMNGREIGQTGILLYAIFIPPFLFSIPLRERIGEREKEYTIDKAPESAWIF